MANVIKSTYRLGSVQADGRQTVVETHLLSDGRDFQFEYLSDGKFDINTVMSLRAERINTSLAAREAEAQEAANGEIPLTKYEFRQRFSKEEKEALDEFNTAFERHPGLSPEQKKEIRSALKDLDAAQVVYISKAQAGVQMYAALGLLSAERAAEILNNG